MCDKVKYPTTKRAKQAAYAIKAKGRIAVRDNLEPYYCITCKSWHLSKQSGHKHSWI